MISDFDKGPTSSRIMNLNTAEAALLYLIPPYLLPVPPYLIAVASNDWSAWRLTYGGQGHHWPSPGHYSLSW